MAQDHNPSEQRGGTTPDENEAREKGEWAAQADEGIVPAELGGSDAPREMLDEDPELGSEVLGKTTGSDEPATEEGIDLSAGDGADATTDGGVELPDGRGARPQGRHGRPPAGGRRRCRLRRSAKQRPANNTWARRRPGQRAARYCDRHSNGRQRLSLTTIDVTTIVVHYDYSEGRVSDGVCITAHVRFASRWVSLRRPASCCLAPSPDLVDAA